MPEKPRVEVATLLLAGDVEITREVSGDVCLHRGNFRMYFSSASAAELAVALMRAVVPEPAEPAIPYVATPQVTTT